MELILAITIGILHEQQLGGVGDIGTAVLRPDASGDEQSLIKHRAFVRFAIAISVFENQDLIALGLSGFDVGIDGTARDPQTTARIPCHLDGLAHHRFTGEKVDLEAIGQAEGLLLFRGIRRGDLTQIALRQDEVSE